MVSYLSVIARPLSKIHVGFFVLRSSLFLILSTFISIMATVLPPPNKRQRTAIAEKAREQQNIDQIPENLGSIRVQFYDQANSGEATGAPISIPVADATVRNLELLLNTLQRNVGGAKTTSCSLSPTMFFPMLNMARIHMNEYPIVLPAILALLFST